MSLKNRAEATAKNIAGKVEEAVGELTGDPKTQAEGQEKQIEASASQTSEDIKDAGTIDLKAQAEATAKNIAGKVEEAVGELTGDPKTQAEGQKKQVEAKIDHVIEDVKDTTKKLVD